MRTSLLLLSLPAALCVAAVSCGDSGGAPSGGDGGLGDGSSSSGSSSGASSGGGDGAGPDGSGSSSGDGGGSSSGDGGDAGALPKGAKVEDLLGVNGFIDDPIDKLAPIGTVREYHNWGWIADNFAAGPAYPGMLYTFMNFNGWDWDVFFADLKAAGAVGFPAVQGGVPWIAGSAVPPIAAGADKTKAASYVAHGDAMFQIAARYGAVKVPDAALKLKANQTRSSGLGTVTYFEDFNEQDNAAGFTGDAFAAMASADYDGDQKRLGDAIGIKNADPGAKLVMGGLSGAYPTANGKWTASITTFLDAMRAWSATNRGGSFPADVVNVHYYSFGPGGSAPAPSPEDDKVQEQLAAIVAYRDKNLPGKELWWTEFGYDTFQASPLHAPPIGGNSAEIVQAQWLVRDFLAAAAAGIDRATVYVLRDGCTPPEPACNIQFATAGLTTAKGSWAPKPSWYFLATFRARLGKMIYAGALPSGDPDVLVYSFKSAADPGGALVVWAKTSAAKTLPGFSLALPARATTAKAVALVDKQASGIETALVPAAGKVKVDVSETPTIVLVDAL
jgi:hypothetical protein